MVDISQVKEHYSRKSDQELIHLAQTDGHELTPDALQALKEEFNKRKLDSQVFDDIENVKSDAAKNKIELANQNASDQSLLSLWQYAFDEKKQARSNQEIENELKHRGLVDADARMIVDSLESKAREGLAASNNNMLLGGIICVAGLAVTFWTYSSAANGGSYVIAWGAILFGAIRFFRGLAGREKFETVLNNILEEQDAEIVEEAEQNPGT
jgi:hypothetical protein